MSSAVGFAPCCDLHLGGAVRPQGDAALPLLKRTGPAQSQWLIMSRVFVLVAMISLTRSASAQQQRAGISCRPQRVWDELHPARGACCRRPATSHLQLAGGMAPGESRTPRSCARLCERNEACTFFSHSTAWNDCYLCASCVKDVHRSSKLYIRPGESRQTQVTAVWRWRPSRFRCRERT